MPTIGELDELYSLAWSAQKQHREETLGGTDLNLARAYSSRLAASLGQGSLAGQRILDFGAGDGVMMDALTEAGAETVGIEPYLSTYAGSGRSRVYAKLEDVPQDKLFDGIVALEVIEHLTEPWKMIAELRDRLRSGGWMFITTPNAAGLNARLRGPDWREAKKCGHIYLFSPTTIDALLRRCNLATYKRLTWRIKYNGHWGHRVLQQVTQCVHQDGALRYLAHKRGSRRNE